MNEKRLGRQTVRLQRPPCVAASASVVGRLEGEGPLGACFDVVSDDAYFGEKSWEKAESTMLRRCVELACSRAEGRVPQLQYILSGDLLNQCAGSAYALRGSGVPFFGLYGACSTMAEGMSLGAMLIDGGYADAVCAATSSHFCSSERQFRFPLEYGGVRPPSAQWTVTGAGALILQAEGAPPYLTHVTTGRIADPGVTDAANMGAAMAQAAYETLAAHFADTGRAPADYDLIVTGDLGRIGRALVIDLFAYDGVELASRYQDCGVMIFDPERQDVHAGGSGCGCSASVLCGHLLREMRRGTYRRMLFAATGALMSPTTSLQGESIPGICHAVCLDMDRGCCA